MEKCIVRYLWLYKARVFTLELDLWIYDVYREEKESEV